MPQGGSSETTTTPRSELEQRAAAEFERRRIAAQVDVNAFIEFVARVRGGGAAHQARCHREWQAIWSGATDLDALRACGDGEPAVREYEAGDGCYSVVLAPVGSGKTTNLTYRLIWELGRNSNTTIAIIGITEDHPKSILAQIKHEIEHNPRVRAVFPRLEPHQTRKLWTTEQILVQRPSMERDPSIRVFGLFGKILGKRLDIVVLDDIINLENSLTEHSRKKIWDWIRSEVLSRLQPKTEKLEGARVWAIGHIWHDKDALQELRRLDRTTYARYEALVPTDGAKWPDDHEAWPIEQAANSGDYSSITPRIVPASEFVSKFKDLGPIRGPMMILNRLVDATAGRFRREWFEACLLRGFETGHHGFVTQWNRAAATYTGVDLGHRASPGSDLTSMWTFAIYPDGSKILLDLRSGNWTGPEIREQLREVSMRFNPIIGVENNGAQKLVSELIADLESFSIRDHETGMNKHDFQNGVEAFGLSFADGDWILPCDENGQAIPEVAEFIAETLAYDPQRHAGDRLMAAWIASETARKSPSGIGIEIDEIPNLAAR